MNLTGLNLTPPRRADYGVRVRDRGGRSSDSELQSLRDEHDSLERRVAEQADRRQLQAEKDELRLENARLRSQLA